jgi:hypothetical protein
MDYEEMPHPSRRDTYLVIVICVVVGLPLFVFFNIITFGLFIALAVLALCVGGLGALHYFLWGRAFTQETAWEREEAEMLGEQDHGNWTNDPDY